MEKLAKKLLDRMPLGIERLTLIIGKVIAPTMGGTISIPGVSFKAKSNGKFVEGQIPCPPYITGKRDLYRKANEVAAEVWAYYSAKNIPVKLIGEI